jgi:hypothetical protein
MYVAMTGAKSLTEPEGTFEIVNCAIESVISGELAYLYVGMSHMALNRAHNVILNPICNKRKKHKESIPHASNISSSTNEFIFHIHEKKPN